jgi:hypothetical protein
MSAAESSGVRPIQLASNLLISLLLLQLYLRIDIVALFILGLSLSASSPPSNYAS